MAFVFPDNDWLPFFEKESEKEYFHRLETSVDEEYAARVCYPPYEDIFAAFRYCGFADTKVVILGQDPYINPGQAHGLAFSVRETPPPPSLQNIFKELHTDLGIPIPEGGDLTGWAEQGVLLLNSSLTVRAGQSGAHRDLGWYYLTANVVAHLNRAPEPIVYILWGKWAQGFETYIDHDRHAIIKSAHPSPLSAYSGFFGSRPFSQTNALLEEWGRTPIDWSRVGGVSESNFVRKGQRLYAVEEDDKLWTLSETVGLVGVRYTVPKSVCPTRESLRDFILRNTLF